MKQPVCGLVPMRASRLVALLLLLLATFCVPVSAHNVMMAQSKWFFGRDNIQAAFVLPPALLGTIKGLTEGHYDIENCSEQELREVEIKVIQPYLDKNLSLSVNDQKYPVKVLRIERKNDIQWEMWLSSNGIRFNLTENVVSIDYRLFFEETDDAHFNLAYMYLYDANAHAVPGTPDDSAFLERSTFDAAAHVWETSLKGPAAMHGTPRKPFGANISQYGHIEFLLVMIAVGLSFKRTKKIIAEFLRSSKR